MEHFPLRPHLLLSFLLFAGLSGMLSTTASSSARVPSAPGGGEASGRYPGVEVVGTFEPAGESNVRSSFRLAEGAGLIGTEETGDIFKTTDAGRTWRKVWDGGEYRGIQDVRNFIRAADGSLFITTSEPALVARSTDEGESWSVVAEPKSSRTVGLVELDSGVILAGLRRSENGWTSIVRSDDGFSTFAWIPFSTTEPRQNVTCFGYWGGSTVLAGVGYEGPGRIYRSLDEGLSWEKMTDLPGARDLMNFFRTNGAVHVLASGVATIYRSGDDGATWTPTHRLWPRGFLGQVVRLDWGGRTLLLLAATDQSEAVYRHVVMISDDDGESWTEWIELATDTSGAASNLSVLAGDTVVVGTGNHSNQGRVYTLRVRAAGN